VYLDLYMPLGHAEDDSNSSPVEAMWEIYQAVRDNTGDEIPGYTLLSARDCYKTLSASILEILLMIHFRTTIAHCSAILSQSAKAIEYCDTFIHKILPYLEQHKWKLTSSSKKRIELTTDRKEKCYIQIIVLTTKGANSAHTQLMFVDEVDLCDPTAYEEAKMIPGVFQGRFPITVRLSTRKYAFGLMERAIKEASSKNEKVLRWNLIDMAEYCSDSRCRPEAPRVKRFIPRSLPLQQFSPEDFEDAVDPEDRSEWEEIECYEGCTRCSLLSVCKMKLRDKRTPDQKGDLWKPIPAVVNTIKQVTPDTGEAQLRCNKPSTKGLIYPRFDGNDGENVISVGAAYEMIHGEPPEDGHRVTFDELIDYIHELGLKLYAGMDYGYSANHAMVVGALLPSGEFLVLDCYSRPELELDDIKVVCEEWQKKYRITKWFPDPAYPAYNKTLGKIVPVHKFTKDVPMGIEAVRGVVINSANRRKMKILMTLNNMVLIDGFGVYHWKLHHVTKEPTDEPDDTGDEADILDAFRYLCQNLFGKTKGKVGFATTAAEKRQATEGKTREQVIEEVNKRIVYGSVPAKTASEAAAVPASNSENSKGKKIVWNF